jgi:hypothetical protein
LTETVRFPYTLNLTVSSLAACLGSKMSLFVAPGFRFYVLEHRFSRLRVQSYIKFLYRANFKTKKFAIFFKTIPANIDKRLQTTYLSDKIFFRFFFDKNWVGSLMTQPKRIFYIICQ